MKLKDFVNVYQNKSNNQIKLEVKKNSLKRMDLDVKDILNLSIDKKMEKFNKL